MRSKSSSHAIFVMKDFRRNTNCIEMLDQFTKKMHINATFVMLVLPQYIKPVHDAGFMYLEINLKISCRISP